MPKIAGNEQYYKEVQIEMDRTGVPSKDAEVQMLYRTISTMRIQEKKSFAEIRQFFQDTWGLSMGAFYTRLAWVRKKYVCP